MWSYSYSGSRLHPSDETNRKTDCSITAGTGHTTPNPLAR